MTAINDRRDRVTVQAPERVHSAPVQSAWRHGYARWLTVADAAAVLVAVMLAQWLRFGGLDLDSRPRGWSYLEVSVAIAIGWLAALSINHSRSERVIGSGVEEYRRVWIATLSVFGSVAIISMLFKLEIARGYLMIALPVGAISLLFFRWLARQIVRRERAKRGKFVTRVVAVGAVDAVRDLATALAREPGSGFTVVGACVPGRPECREIQVNGVGVIPTYGDEFDVTKAVCATNSSAVAVTAAEQLCGRQIRDLSWELESSNIDLMVVPGVVDVAGPRLHMRPVAGLPLIHVEKPQYHGAKRFEKRFFDIVFSSAILLCSLPLLLAIAIAIKLTSKGPVFYSHERIGLNGRSFRMIKFRTMIVGADAIAGDIATMNLVASPRDPLKFVNDPRVTAVGRVLRKYSLDELPQFINVLKRDMSVVGPRPQVMSEVEAYDDYARRRLLVRPGITGLWQVSGRSNLSWEDSVRLDLFYVENWSMMADIIISLQTVKAVANHSGAY